MLGLVRAFQVTGVAAILAGIGVLGSFLLTENRKEAYPLLTWSVYTGNSFLIVLAFLGFYLRMAEAAPLWGLAAFLLATLGSILTTYPQVIGTREGYQVGSALLGAAIALLAAGSFLTGVFPVWISGLWAATIVLGIPGIFLPSYQSVSYVLGGLPFSFGVMAAGYLLLATG